MDADRLRIDITHHGERAEVNLERHSELWFADGMLVLQARFDINEVPEV